jgi:hypothetical protein
MSSNPPIALTPYAVLNDAYVNAGLLEAGETLEGDLLAFAFRRLNSLFNLLQTQGLKLWLQSDVSITPVAGQNLYSLGTAGNVAMTRPTRVVYAYYRNSSNQDYPLIPLSWNDWVTLSEKVSGQPSLEGAINSYLVDKQVNTLNVYLWLTPDSVAATGTVHLVLQQQQSNVISLTDDIQFPPEWGLGLGWMLANEICTGQPTSIMARCKQFAEQYRQMLEDWDVEDAPTEMQIDTRYQYQGNSFK